jgi:hypothetical protein
MFWEKLRHQLQHHFVIFRGKSGKGQGGKLEIFLNPPPPFLPLFRAQVPK